MNETAHPALQALLNTIPQASGRERDEAGGYYEDQYRLWAKKGFEVGASSTQPADQNTIANILAWVDSRIEAEVTHRPDVNIHKERLARTWGQIRNHLVSLQSTSTQPASEAALLQDPHGIARRYHLPAVEQAMELLKELGYKYDLGGDGLRWIAPAQPSAVKTMDLDFARAMCRSAGISLVSRNFIERFADFVADWKKGDFTLPRYAELDMQSCFDAWQAFDPEFASTPPVAGDVGKKVTALEAMNALFDYANTNESAERAMQVALQRFIDARNLTTSKQGGA